MKELWWRMLEYWGEKVLQHCVWGTLVWLRVTLVYLGGGIWAYLVVVNRVCLEVFLRVVHLIAVLEMSRA